MDDFYARKVINIPTISINKPITAITVIGSSRDTNATTRVMEL